MAGLASARRRGSEVNVGRVQRAASVAAGAALVAFGSRRRSVAGGLAALAGGDLLYRGVTGYCHVLGALGIDTAHRDGLRGAPAKAVELQRSLTIELPRDEVYRRWRDARSQPEIWGHFAALTDATEAGAHWRVDAPLGRTLEWDTRIVEERDGELIRWESTGGNLPNEGTIELRDAPGDFGTEITLRMRFDPPGGPLGDVATRLFDDPAKLVLAKALRRFKSLVESGEIPSTEHDPSGRDA